MKVLKFKKLLLLSNKAKSGKKIEFDPKMTVLSGPNNTGKSCVLKSLYYVLGAETKQHPKWKNDNVIYLLYFEIDSEKFEILRSEGFFALFENGDLVGTYKNVTKELGPKLAELFDFRLKILNRKGESVVPLPAFLYLPYYIDQDLSWNSNWNSFLNLGQFSNWKKHVCEYIICIHPNDYYEEKANKDRLKIKKNDVIAELKIQNQVLKKISEKKEEIGISYNLKNYEEEIIKLLEKINSLRGDVQIYKNNLSTLYIDLDLLLKQKAIVKSSKDELSKDYKFATNKITENGVDCPTCGTHFINSFSERFSIAKDEDRCTELLVEIIKDISKIEIKIDIQKKSLSSNESTIISLNDLLLTTKREVTLQEVLRNESMVLAKDAIFEDINKNEKKLTNIEIEIKSSLNALKTIDDKNRIDDIKNHYLLNMKTNLHQLDAHTLTEDDYKKVNTNISEIGSDLPRSLLAYYYAIIDTITNKSNTTIFPLIIDSPNQNAQDSSSLLKMYSFILSKNLNDIQVILGTEDPLNLNYPGTMIKLKNKYKLLDEALYEKVHSEINPFITKAFDLE